MGRVSLKVLIRAVSGPSEYLGACIKAEGALHQEMVLLVFNNLLLCNCLNILFAQFLLTQKGIVSKACGPSLLI